MGEKLLTIKFHYLSIYAAVLHYQPPLSWFLEWAFQAKRPWTNSFIRFRERKMRYIYCSHNAIILIWRLQELWVHACAYASMYSKCVQCIDHALSLCWVDSPSNQRLLRTCCTYHINQSDALIVKFSQSRAEWYSYQSFLVILSQLSEICFCSS